MEIPGTPDGWTRLTVELDGRAASKDLSRYARRWFVAASKGPLKDLFSDLQRGPKLSRHIFGSGASGKPWGEPGGLWASLLRFNQSHGKATGKRVWSPRAWDEFIAALDDLPLGVELRIFELDENGIWTQDKVTVSMQRVSPDGQWFRARCVVTAGPLGPKNRVAKFGANDMVGLLRDCSADIPATFGCVTDDGGAHGTTGLEDRLYISAEAGIQSSPEILRGYPWITICPPGLAERLGGLAAIRATGAFYEVSSLRAGGLWLQATERIEDYEGEALRRVFRVLAPVLPPGRPEPYVGTELHRIIYKDARNM
ncbi:hypothetical protein GCM10023191_069910 [Actinoallomurus oryzae]|uniref:Uncharacterized protein n=1 Tax=Actinoallomurus oryzae TaxID=502180 RepID=A0ABP8QRU1_9ACTN